MVLLPGLCLVHHDAGVGQGNFSVLRAGEHECNLLNPGLVFERLKHDDALGSLMLKLSS